jgi:tight adherence protein C
MSGALVPFVGAAMVFVGLVAATVALLRSSAEPTGVARSLLVIEQAHPGRAVARADLPASDRILAPALRRLVWLARRVTPAGTPDRLQRRLDLAGNPDRWTVERLLAVKSGGLVSGALLGGLLAWRGGGALALAFLLGLAAIGLWLPDILLYNAGTKRQESLRRTVPDALDMLTVCVEAGLGFDAGLAQVSRNISGAIAGEFARLLQEMRIGKSRIAAFQDLAARTTVPELHIFVSALVQSDKLGIPVAGVLREQSHEMRLKRRQRAEEQAQKVPVKILFPLLLTIFPSLFVVVIGPAAIQMVHSFAAMS